MKRTLSPHRIASLIVSILLALTTTVVQAAISGGERTALVKLYIETNGDAWTTSTNWNGAAGTECTWFGVTCDAGGTTVTRIFLSNNHLTGSLPALTGLTNLQQFFVHENQLTGTIPVLTGLTNLLSFGVHYNQLTGTIPALSGLTNLQAFRVYSNQLTGTIPALSGLTNLHTFSAGGNQLTGPIPALAGLTNLDTFEVYNNQLTGTIPALTGLTGMRYFWVFNNRLTGNVPSVPTPNTLVAGGSRLCPNALNHTPDPAWDTVTGETPWYTNCHPLNLVPILELLLLD